jgi:CDP-diacylglycerol--serine O-phosphatidyltransferase
MKRTEWKWAAHVLTATSLFLGFWAIIEAFDGNYLMACWLIVIASICDGLDGKIARYTKSSSELGVELDSLADIVSFGVAPSVLLYTISFHKFGFSGILLAALPLFFGAVRLARFNVSASLTEKKNYVGLPIPMQATTIATFIVFNHALWGSLTLEILLLPITLALTLLMVSQISYDAMPRLTFHDTRKNLFKLLLIIAGIIVVAINPSLFFFPLMVIYVLKGIIFAVMGLQIPEEELEEVWEDEKLI